MIFITYIQCCWHNSLYCSYAPPKCPWTSGHGNPRSLYVRLPPTCFTRAGC